jgi:type III secretion protein C
MNPKIITQDGHTSNIFVGQNIPFVGSFVSNTASNTVQSSNIEYRDVGVNLTITPSLGTNNIITLDIQQDISQQTNNTTQIQGSQVTGIQTSLTTMSTRVHVPDRHFLVLSGMIQDTKTHFRTSIPCLGGLPVIGALFSENDRYDTKNNIIIFLRPFIIDSFEDYDRLTAAEEGLYKEQAALQDLKEEFDAGTEMIKDLDNE